MSPINLLFGKVFSFTYFNSIFLTFCSSFFLNIPYSLSFVILLITYVPGAISIFSPFAAVPVTPCFLLLHRHVLASRCFISISLSSFALDSGFVRLSSSPIIISLLMFSIVRECHIEYM